MANKIPITGIVEGVSGFSPGPSSGISYSITANLPSGPITLDNQVPSLWRYGDAVEIDAGLLVGRLFPGTLDGNDIWWHFTEPIAWAMCPGVPGSPNPLTIRIDPTTGMPIAPPPPGGGSPGIPNSTVAPDKGA